MSYEAARHAEVSDERTGGRPGATRRTFLKRAAAVPLLGVGVRKGRGDGTVPRQLPGATRDQSEQIAAATAVGSMVSGIVDDANESLLLRGVNRAFVAMGAAVRTPAGDRTVVDVDSGSINAEGEMFEANPGPQGAAGGFLEADTFPVVVPTEPSAIAHAKGRYENDPAAGDLLAFAPREVDSPYATDPDDPAVDSPMLHAEASHPIRSGGVTAAAAVAVHGQSGRILKPFAVLSTDDTGDPEFEDADADDGGEETRRVTDGGGRATTAPTAVDARPRSPFANAIGVSSTDRGGRDQTEGDGGESDGDGNDGVVADVANGDRAGGVGFGGVEIQDDLVIVEDNGDGTATLRLNPYRFSLFHHYLSDETLITLPDDGALPPPVSPVPDEPSIDIPWFDSDPTAFNRSVDRSQTAGDAGPAPGNDDAGEAGDELRRAVERRVRERAVEEGGAGERDGRRREDGPDAGEDEADGDDRTSFRFRRMDAPAAATVVGADVVFPELVLDAPPGRTRRDLIVAYLERARVVAPPLAAAGYEPTPFVTAVLAPGEPFDASQVPEAVRTAPGVRERLAAFARPTPPATYRFVVGVAGTVADALTTAASADDGPFGRSLRGHSEGTTVALDAQYTAVETANRTAEASGLLTLPEVTGFVTRYNDRVGTVPGALGPLVSLVGDEEVRVRIDTPGGPEFWSGRLRDRTVVSYERGRGHAPGVEITAERPTVRRVLAAEDPVTTGVAAYDAGAIGVRGLGFFNAIEVGLMTAAYGVYRAANGLLGGLF